MPRAISQVCARRPCRVPLDVSPWSIQVSGLLPEAPPFTVDFGQEPSAALALWTDRVMATPAYANASAHGVKPPGGGVNSVPASRPRQILGLWPMKAIGEI